jgi:uncharacterized MAPEG superfamily protein
LLLGLPNSADRKKRWRTPFAALVIVAQLTGKANAMTAFWAACYFWLRLAHAVVFWFAIPYIRTVIFTLAFVAIVGIFVEVIR